jgi:hypothetical protein
MKTIAALLLSACCCLGQATVTFHVQDPFGRALPLRRVSLQPVVNMLPATNGVGQVTGDYLVFATDASANATVTNVTAGTYRQVTFGPTVTTTNYLLIPATTNTIAAKDWVTLYPTGIGFIMWEEAGVVGGRIRFEP